MDRTVLFLHAYPLDATLWERQAAGLPRGWRALAPHLPGFGGRPCREPSLEAFADAVMEDVDRAGVDRFVACGLSMGGYLAFRLVARCPGRLEGLVLCDTRAAPDTEAARERRGQQAARARAEGVGWLADAMVPALLADATRRQRPAVEAVVRGIIARADPEGVARALLALGDRPDATPLLGGIACPVLCLAGAADSLTPPSEMDGMAAAIPRARFEVLAGAGHLSNLEAPEAFDEALHGFLASL